MHTFFLGILLGWGAAIPIGPMNLEIVRRNLRFGTPYGLALGLGACSADLIYIVLLSMGALIILTHPIVLDIVTVLGSFVLAWFGIMALRTKTKVNNIETGADNTTALQTTYAWWRHVSEGLLMTLVNPYTILFWSSVSTQIANVAHAGTGSSYLAIIGVIIGTTSWIIVLNATLHHTRHRLSAKTMHYLNMAGGLILLGFAVLGIWRVL